MLFSCRHRRFRNFKLPSVLAIPTRHHIENLDNLCGTVAILRMTIRMVFRNLRRFLEARCRFDQTTARVGYLVTIMHGCRPLARLLDFIIFKHVHFLHELIVHNSLMGVKYIIPLICGCARSSTAISLTGVVNGRVSCSSFGRSMTSCASRILRRAGLAISMMRSIIGRSLVPKDRRSPSCSLDCVGRLYCLEFEYDLHGLSGAGGAGLW